jgi:hypothetical protein
MPTGSKLSFRVIDAHIGARLRQRRTEFAISGPRKSPPRERFIIIRHVTKGWSFPIEQRDAALVT